MYATIERTSGGAAEHNGASERLRLARVAGSGELLVNLWDREPAGPEVYQVEVDKPLTDAGKPAEFAAVVTFSGPVSQPVKDASDRAGHERIGPAMVGHPGAVRMLALWQPEQRRQVIITMATSMQSLEEGGRKVSSLPLLPGEDVALLPGPDHVELFRVQS